LLQSHVEIKPENLLTVENGWAVKTSYKNLSFNPKP